MNAADISPVPSSAHAIGCRPVHHLRGANIVATTLQVGAALCVEFSPEAALVLMAGGATAGSLLVTALAVLGPRLGVPSVIAARAALGVRGAGLVAALLYVTNFAWIGVNNVIAASVGARLLGGDAALPAWVVGLGLVSTAVVALGPRAVGLADRVAVPLLLAVGAVITWAVIQAPPNLSALASQPAPTNPGRGFDIVVGYQVSWILMFADFSAHQVERTASTAVFLACSDQPVDDAPRPRVRPHGGQRRPGRDDVRHRTRLGRRCAHGACHGDDELRQHLHVRARMEESVSQDRRPGVDLVDRRRRDRGRVVLWRVARPVRRVHDGARRCPRAGGGVLAPLPLSRTPACRTLRTAGPYRGVLVPGVAAWALGALAYYLAAPWGGTLPALVTAVVSYLLLHRR
jgi:hypothetical protein